MNMDDFTDIRPYSDAEARDALNRISHYPMLPVISKYVFPKEDSDFLGSLSRDIQGVDDFQFKVMTVVVSSIILKTSEGFTYSGMENITALKGKRFLAMTNHRDIVLDPSLVQNALKDSGIPFTEICVGNNLLENQLIEDLMRSNRMIKVIRGISARQLYLSSQLLSKYIRESITSDRSSIWIAQREGRTKDGLDSTEQGLLKMFDLSGEKGFAKNFEELNIVPMSISYEYESCDSRKARELYIKRTTGTYEKKKGEDTHSIMMGIKQKKGHIHLSVGKPLASEDFEAAAALNGNDRYQFLRGIYDKKILEGYKLWKTNYIGHDLANGKQEYMGVKYLPEDLDEFLNYTEHKIGKLENNLDKNAVRQIFWEIYGNPVENKKQHGLL